MRWLRSLMWWQPRTPTKGTIQAQEVHAELEGQKAEVQKLTHSLRDFRHKNHIAEKLRRAMRDAR